MSRELLQQALELLEVADQPEGYVPDFHDTIKAIRAHLAAQPLHEQLREMGEAHAAQPAPVPDGGCIMSAQDGEWYAEIVRALRMEDGGNPAQAVRDLLSAAPVPDIVNPKCPDCGHRALGVGCDMRVPHRAAQPAPEECYCDRMKIGVPGVSCGDCPRDYKPAQPALVPERWVVVCETILDVGHGKDVRTGGKPELGYALLSHAVTFPDEDAARAAHRSADLPLGWVIMPLSRLLPDLPAAPVPAKCDGGTCGAGGYCDNCPKQAAAPVPADPTMTRDELVAAAESIGMRFPAPVPVPLTADDIWLLWTRACEKPQLTRGLVCDFARAIERAHGIAASPEVPHG
jgi:hypothetical protein